MVRSITLCCQRGLIVEKGRSRTGLNGGFDLGKVSIMDGQAINGSLIEIRPGGLTLEAFGPLD